MGSNVADKQYLDEQCHLEVGLPRRILGPPQIRPFDGLLEYSCAPSSHSFKVLFTGNCTGNYFGKGPTCRCEETMRFFWYSSRFSKVQWFMFIDDDLYIRPAPLMTMLAGFVSMMDQPIAIVKYGQLYGTGLLHLNNRSECRGQFRLAMPAILNRRAVAEMQATFDANGMMQTHKVWGGSHDVILGIALWILQIPLYPISFGYCDQRIKSGMLDNLNNRYTAVLDRAIITHNVKGELGLISQTEIHAHYRNASGAKRISHEDNSAVTLSIRKAEVSLGRKVHEQMLVSAAELREAPVSRAVLAFRKVYNLSSAFRLFEKFFCDPEFFDVVSNRTM